MHGDHSLQHERFIHVSLDFIMRNPITPSRIQNIKALAAQKGPTKEIARHLGVSESTVHKVRQGYYDYRLFAPESDSRGESNLEVSWCSRCRCHVFPPCELCKLNEFQERQSQDCTARNRAPLPDRISDRRELDRLKMSVAEIGLPVRTVNYLQQRSIFTINDLLHCTREELLRIPNFAVKTLEHVYRCLERLNFVRRSRRQQPAASRGEMRVCKNAPA